MPERMFEKMKEVNTAADMEKDRLSATKESSEGLSTEIKLVSDMSTEISGKTKELDTLKNDISTSIEQACSYLTGERSIYRRNERQYADTCINSKGMYR